MSAPDAMFAPLGAEAAAPAADTWAPIMPASLPLPEALRHKRHGTPSHVWRYLDAEGRLLHAVARFDPPGGRKEILPMSCGPDGWQWYGPKAPRPLYRLDVLAARPDAPVLIVEGEKACDAARALFADRVSITWSGGAAATAKADWRPLAGRRVAIWPDCDDPGRRAAAAVAKAARAAGAASVAIVDVPSGWPAGWDLADAPPDGVTLDALRDMLRAAEAEAAEPASAANALRADVERAADMTREDWAVARREMARRHRVPVGELDALRGERLRDRRAAEAADDGADEAPADDRGRRDLEVVGADLPDTARDLAERLAELPNLFDRGGPARVTLDTTRGASVVERLTLNSVVNLAHRVARPWQWTRTRDGEPKRVNVTLPERVARLYLDARETWRLRPLDGVTTAPLLADDGTIRTADGYDATTRLWCENLPAVDVPAAPTRQDAEAALRTLRRHFRTFAFADATRRDDATAPVPIVDPDRPPAADESAALVALLTACARPCLWLAPALLVRAPALSGAGCGKGLLVRALAAIAFGLRPAAITAGGTTEELDKRLVAALIEAAPVLMLDNVNGAALRSDALAAAITERPAVVRPLGQSATVPLNPTAWAAITGNGVNLSEDLARRFLAVELDAGTEDPEARPFVGDFLADTFAARSALLAAALTIWRWGRREGGALPRGKALGSFEQWSRWCRDPLVALGCADPVARVAELKAKDPRRQAAAEVFGAWWRLHADAPMAVADLAEAVTQAADPAGRGRQYLAARVRGLAGTRAAGFVLVHSPSDGKWSADRYALRRTDGAEAARPARHGAAGWGTEF
jgi:hypothetical protein